jgi:hypothetical protein
MKRAPLLVALFTVLILGCSPTSTGEDSHAHESSGLKPQSITSYTEKLELFVEFNPLIVGEISNFSTHFTQLGELFTPLINAKVSVSLVVEKKGIKNTAETHKTPGFYSLALKPIKAGKGTLKFEIKSETFDDEITLQNVIVYANIEEAKLANSKIIENTDLVFLKDQAWSTKFATQLVKLQDFNEIIKTTGEILSAPGDESVVIAGSSGIVNFSGVQSAIGSEISLGSTMFTISGGALTSNNIQTKYKEAKFTLDAAKIDFERAQELIKDKIISEKEFLQSPMSGYIKNIYVKEGEYVEMGTPLAVISKNKKLILKANITQKHFNKLAVIKAANFKTVYDNTIYETDTLNGSIISFGKSTVSNSAYLPITFQIDNIGNLIPGSIVEVFLKASKISNSIVLPISALIEEQGLYFVYIQTDGEHFQKREVKIGGNNGKEIQILNGIKEGERAVIIGALHIKLATASGSLPAHSHEH